MATWTNQQKSAQPSAEYLLLIDDTFFLNIDDNYQLIIQDASPGTVWTNVQKS